MNRDQLLTDLVSHVCRSGRITFTEMNQFLKSSGVALSGDEFLTGEHIGQPHVDVEETLYGPVSDEYVDLVAGLFKYWPVRLMIGDPADFRSGEEQWWIAWTGRFDEDPENDDDVVDLKRPAINPDSHDIADRAKYNYARGTQVLSAVHYRIAEMAGVGQISHDESMDLQEMLVRAWEALYYGTTAAVRDEDTSDWTWDKADNTYSDGRTVVTRTRASDWEDLDHRWEFNYCLLGEGAVADIPRGTIWEIAPPPRVPDRHEALPPVAEHLDEDVSALRDRLERHR